MQTKRMIALVLSMICLCTVFSTTAFADTTYAIGGVAPAYEYANKAFSELSISDQTAYCVSKADGDVVSITVEQTLEKYSGRSRSWNDVDNASWSKTVNRSLITLSNTVSNLDSGTYRLRSVFTLTTSSGKTETITVYSTEKTVKLSVRSSCCKTGNTAHENNADVRSTCVSRKLFKERNLKMKTIKIKTAIAAAIITVCALGTTAFATIASAEDPNAERRAAPSFPFDFSLSGKGDADYSIGYAYDATYLSVRINSGSLSANNPMLFNITTEKTATSYITETITATAVREKTYTAEYLNNKMPEDHDTIYLRGASKYDGCSAAGTWRP